MSDRSPNIIFRSVNASELPGLIAILSRDVTGMLPNDPARDVPNTFNCPAARILVAMIDEQIVGTLTASWGGRNGELRYFWIEPRLRRSRMLPLIFNGLFDSAVEYLQSVNMRRVLLFVRPNQQSRMQIRMYERKLNARVVNPIVMALEIS